MTDIDKFLSRVIAYMLDHSIMLVG